MEVRALFGRFVWRGVNIDDTMNSRGSRINPILKLDSTTTEFRFNTKSEQVCLGHSEGFGLFILVVLLLRGKNDIFVFVFLFIMLIWCPTVVSQHLSKNDKRGWLTRSMIFNRCSAEN